MTWKQRDKLIELQREGVQFQDLINWEDFIYQDNLIDRWLVTDLALTRQLIDQML